MVDYIEGTVYVNDELVPDPIVATFPYIKENATLRTEEGRAEALMQGGVSLRLGENSTLRMVSSRFVDTRVELQKGSAVVQVLELVSGNNLTLVLKDASISLLKSGDYRFDAEPARLKVYAGQAVVTVGEQKIEVGAGKMLNLSGQVASAEKFDKEAIDSLDRWSMERGAIQANASLSASRDVYLSSAGSNPCRGYSYGGYVSSTSNPCGSWRWNPYFGIITYIPFGGRICDAYWGYCLYNPGMIMGYYNPPSYFPSGGGSTPSFSSSPATSGGYSGAAAASSTMSSAPSSGSGSTAGAAASSSSAGAGSSSGGHGR
jgi:hypothetical protein